MSIHVYYLNPLYDFSCKQLLAAIILSNELLYSGHGGKLFIFSDSFSIVKILLKFISPFTMGNTEKFFIYEKRFGDKQLARSIYEFRPVKRAYYFLM